MIGKTLSHYEILEKLGAGGMGEVYLAKDTTLKRRIALKVLPPEFARDKERLERFQREAEALASLDHPNIVTIFSVEESESVHFLTMELVDGQPLSKILTRKGLSLERLLEIALPLAEALAAAHSKGITHRDIKPQNVMLASDGRVKVLDFGLAKFAQHPSESDVAIASDVATEGCTQQGVILGSVPYMSPEQASGRAVDPRSDVFSLGIVLFEMATGRKPFEGNSAIELLSAILKEQPPSLGSLKPGLPQSLRRVIGRSLAKNPDERYQDAEELHRALSSISNTPDRKEAPSEAPWIAVLPLKARGGDEELESLAEGFMEDIITGLSRFSHLFVISASSASRYKGQAVDVREVGAELGARFVIEGSIRKVGSSIRVNVQLLDASTGTHLWAEHFDQDVGGEGLFAAQDELTDRIVATVADTYGVLTRSLAALVRTKRPSHAGLPTAAR